MEKPNIKNYTEPSNYIEALEDFIEYTTENQKDFLEWLEQYSSDSKECDLENPLNRYFLAVSNTVDKILTKYKEL